MSFSNLAGVTRAHQIVSHSIQTVRNPAPGSHEINGVTVSGSSANAVGGAIAVRAARLVEAPGARSITLANLNITECEAKRGGGTRG